MTTISSFLPHNFVCDSCHNRRNASQPPVLVAEKPICQICFRRILRPGFYDALGDDAKFPLLYNKTAVDVDIFKYVVREEDIDAYIEKSRRLFRPDFYCAVCPGNVRSVHPSVDVVGNAVCTDCFEERVLPLFKAAIKSEQEYPPKWGKTVIRIEAFVKDGLVGNDLVSEYLNKEEEYRVPPQERVYCAQQDCNQSVIGSAASSSELATCSYCNGLTCLNCRRYTLNTALPEDFAPHDCESYSALDDISSTFPEEHRGIEWQLCPGCGALSTLEYGCNHVVCTHHFCEMEYCFHCGTPVHENSGHWRRGCPQHPNGDGDEDEDDHDEDEEGEDFFDDDFDDEEEQGETMRFLFEEAGEGL